MVRHLGGTVGGPDLTALMAAILDALPYTRRPPVGAIEGLLSRRPLPSDWRERLLTPITEREFGVEWEHHETLARGEETIMVDFPDRLRDPKSILEFLTRLPFELFVMSIAQDYWPENDYRAPAISGEHALFGWGMAFKGAGHEHSIVSRRWLEHGPFRTLHGANGTTLVQFHDLDADGPTSLAQAKPGHAWIVEGFLRRRHRYRHSIGGIYTKQDRLLRIVINGREVSPEEMLDACAARRDRRNDPEKPIDNVAYIFVDEGEARVHLEALWLRGLECRVADGRGERRLDDAYRPTITKPSWA